MWFKAHYRDWSKPPSDFDQTEWLMRHTALLNEQKALWAGGNRRVYVEGQNAFRLRGKAATLAGRPDLVVLDDRDATIIDVKTGREQVWHRVQVMIYQYAVPLPYRSTGTSGSAARSCTPPTRFGFPRERCQGQFVDDLGALIRRLASDTPPGQVPSSSECRFCDISALDCPERMDDNGSSPEGTTNDF